MSKYGHRNMDWFEAIVNKLGGEEGAERFLRGELIISEREYVIDCSAPVFVPDGWSVLPDSEQLPNRVLGKFKFDPAKIRRHYEGQKNGQCIGIDKFREALKNQKVLTAHVLDFLLKKENQHLIPEEWEASRNIFLYSFFWGTIYQDTEGRSVVRCLSRDMDIWEWDYSCVSDDSIAIVDNPAVVCNSICPLAGG